MALVQRALRFLTSRKNIGGCLLALGGVALFALGFTTGWVALAATLGLYALGYFLVPPERGVPFTLFNERDAQQIRQGLNDLTYSLRFRVADDVMDTSGIGEQISAGERVRVTWQPQHTFVIKGQAVSPEAEGGTQVA